MTPIEAGNQVGPYRIDALIGAGGMGQVFRGFDTRLDRVVAIKTSREQFSDRFAREARTIAQLNHPHICTLYDVGPTYLVMELVEGESLSGLLRRGPLPVELVFRYGMQIADALAAAHAKGIVHRDLKPHNVMVTKKGVKVLDFGLAKTAQDDTITGTEVVLGTPAYMAPEQRAGKPTDARTDLYALGLVLREMAAGRESTWLTGIIERCLAADPEDRWQSARDVMAALDLMAAVRLPPATQPTVNRPPRRFVMIAGLAVVLAAAAAYGLWPAVPESAFEFSIVPPEGTSFPHTAQAGPPALSPDAKKIAFVAGRSGERLLWVRSLDAFDARSLPGTEGAANPSWSPDGRSLAFIAQGNLKKVEIAGGQPQVLANFATFTPAWNEEGRILFSRSANELFAVSASGGEPEPITQRNVELFEENHFFPFFLPDHRHYLLLVRGGPELEYQVYLGELGSNERRLLLKRSTNAQYAPPRAGGPGHLLFVRDRKLMAQPFDLEQMTLQGKPVTIAERVAVTYSGGGGDFSVSPGGVLAYRVESQTEQEMIWYDRDGKPIGSIGNGPGNTRNNLRLSPNGRFVAFTRQGEETQDIWIYDLDRRAASRFTFGGGRSPVWSPDGLHLAFLREDVIYRKPVSGTGSELPVWRGAGLMALNDWSGDGRHLLFTRWEAKTGRGLWLLPDPLRDSSDREPQLLESPALHGQFAPAVGAPRWVSFDKEEGNIRQVFVRTMPGGPQGRWQVPSPGGNGARWRSDARELFIPSGSGVVVLDVDPTSSFRVGPPRPLFPIPRGIATAVTQYAPGYDVTPDGKKFLATNPGGDIPSQTIHIVINWQAKLRQ